ncbi:MAG: hypothetical protein ACLP4V_07105, partial [Methylocella sp.]
MGKADRIQGPAIQRLARLSRLVAVSGCSGPSAVSLHGHAGSVTSAAFLSGRAPPPSTTTRRGCEAAAFGSTKKNALDWPMARFRFVEVDFG